jgi:hypothetical protein
MKFTLPLAFAVCLLEAGAAVAYAGMDKTLEEIKRASIDSRQSTSLIGDLKTLPAEKLTKTGRAIKAILEGSGVPQDLSQSRIIVPPLNSPRCRSDTCCVWKYIADEMHEAMVGTAFRCNSVARQGIRLGFHDAGTWTTAQGNTGGADGSIILARECEERRENTALIPICAMIRSWHDKYQSFGVSYADLCQMAANVGAVSCPLGPRVRTYVGRKDSSTPAPTGTLPPPFGTADSLIAMFQDKTFTPAELVALLGAHTVSQQTTVDPARVGDPQDSTPGVWDTLYFRETADPNAPSRIFKFPSDVAIANDPRTKPTWDRFARLGLLAQHGDAYARAYVRMSLLGVPNINELTDCTWVLPSFISNFVNPDQPLLDKFIDGDLDFAAEPLHNGDEIPAL